MTEVVDMNGVSFVLDCPYFVSFRMPTTTSVFLTYPVPPPLTIRGLVENALGEQYDSNRLSPDKVKIGIDIIRAGSKNSEMITVRKLKPLSNRVSKSGVDKLKKEDPDFYDQYSDMYDDRILTLFSREIKRLGGVQRRRWNSELSSVVFREFLVRPKYKIYLVFDQGGDESLAKECFKAMQDPDRSLYLGDSDSLVIVDDVCFLEDVVSIKSDRARGLVPYGIVDARVFRLPYSFCGDSLVFKFASLRDNTDVVIKDKLPAYKSGKTEFYAM